MIVKHSAAYPVIISVVDPVILRVLIRVQEECSRVVSGTWGDTFCVNERGVSALASHGSDYNPPLQIGIFFSLGYIPE